MGTPTDGQRPPKVTAFYEAGLIVDDFDAQTKREVLLNGWGEQPYYAYTFPGCTKVPDSFVVFAGGPPLPDDGVSPDVVIDVPSKGV